MPFFLKHPGKWHRAETHHAGPAGDPSRGPAGAVEDPPLAQGAQLIPALGKGFFADTMGVLNMDTYM